MPAACFCQSIDLDEIFNMYATDKNLQNVLFEFSVQTKIKKIVKDVLFYFSSFFSSSGQLQLFQNLSCTTFNKLILPSS